MGTEELQSPGGATVPSHRNLQETSNLGQPQTPLKGTSGHEGGGTEQGSRVLIPHAPPAQPPARADMALPSPRCFRMSLSILAPSQPWEQGTSWQEGPLGQCQRRWHHLLPAAPGTGGCWHRGTSGSPIPGLWGLQQRGALWTGSVGVWHMSPV